MEPPHQMLRGGTGEVYVLQLTDRRRAKLRVFLEWVVWLATCVGIPGDGGLVDDHTQRRRAPRCHWAG